eukprot:jgi/Botrbrau1/14891/Bobra.0248s0010.2
MALRKFRKWLDNLSVKAIANRLDKRQLQHELDTHRLFLYLSHNRLAGRESGDVAAHVEQLSLKAQDLGYEGMKATVGTLLNAQVAHIARMIDACLMEAGDPRHAAQPYLQRCRGAPQSSGSGAAGERSWLGAGGRRRPREWSPSEVAPPAIDRSHEEDQCNRSQETPHQATPSGVAPFQASSAWRSPNQDTHTWQGGSASLPPANARAVLPWQRVSEIVKDRLGFTLAVAPSGVGHPDAGDGVWLSGVAKTGAVAALYPGILYPPLFHRDLPGYPKVDAGNDTLLGRYDGGILDALPWGRGPPEECEVPSLTNAPSALHNLSCTAAVPPGGSMAEVDGKDRPRGSLGRAAGASAEYPKEGQVPLPASAGYGPGRSIFAGPNSAAARARVVNRLLALERRNPLAVGHVANHPPRGVKPNVMVAAFDFTAPSEEPWLRAYVPNVTYQAKSEADDRGQEEERWLAEGMTSEPEVVQGLALVALRDLQDEELFLNYRLSPHVTQPDWYWPVDVEENKRRWA